MTAPEWGSGEGVITSVHPERLLINADGEVVGVRSAHRLTLRPCPGGYSATFTDIHPDDLPKDTP